MKNFVFKKSILLSATAMSLALATNANAAINVVQNVDFGTGTATIADITNPIIEAVISSANTTEQSSTFDLSNNGSHYGDGSASSIDMGTVTAINESDYKFDYNGTSTTLDTATYGATTLDKTLYVVDKSSLAAADNDLSGYTTLENGQIARGSLTYTPTSGYTFALGADTDADKASALAALDSGNYQYTTTDAADVNIGNVAHTVNDDGTIVAGTIDNSTYTYVLSDATYVVDATKNHLSDGEPQTSNYKYTDSNGAEYVMTLDGNGDLIIPSTVLSDSTAVANASAALSAYNNDKAAYAARNDDLTTDQTAYETAVSVYNTDVAAFNALGTAYDETYEPAYDEVNSKWDNSNTDYVAALSEYNTDSSNFATAYPNYAAYGSSLAEVIDTKAKAAADDAISGLQGAVGDMNKLIDAGSNTLVDGVLANKDAIDTLNGDENTDGSVAKSVKAEADRAKGIESGLQGAIDTLNGDENTDGSVAKSVKAEADRAKAIESGLQGAIDTLNGDENIDGSVAKSVKAEADRAKAIESGLQGAIDTLNGDENTDGSVAKSVKAEADRVDNILGKINHLADDVAVADGKMNLDQGSSVSTHLRKLASSIGDRTQYTHEYNISSNESVATSVDKLDIAIGDLKSTGVNGASVAEQIKTLGVNAATVQASNEARFNRIENKIDDLQDEMREGLASTAALAGLVPLDNTYKTQLSIAMGGYKDKQAAALGAFHYLTDNIILNAGAAYNGSSNVAYKVGVTVGF